MVCSTHCVLYEKKKYRKPYIGTIQSIVEKLYLLLSIILKLVFLDFTQLLTFFCLLLNLIIFNWSW